MFDDVWNKKIWAQECWWEENNNFFFDLDIRYFSLFD